MPTIQDFIDLMIEPSMQLIAVYDFKEEREIFHGDAVEIPSDIVDRTIESIDTVEGNRITFNV